MIGVKPFTHQHVHRVLLQRQFQQHRFVLQEIETVPGDAAAPFEIDQVVLLGQRDVVLHRERKLADRRGATLHFGAGGFIADRRQRMRHVRQAAVDRVRLGRERFDLLLLRFAHFAKLPALFLALFALGIGFGGADGLAHHVRLPGKLFDLLLQRAAQVPVPRTGRHPPSRREYHNSAALGRHFPESNAYPTWANQPANGAKNPTALSVSGKRRSGEGEK